VAVHEGYLYSGGREGATTKHDVRTGHVLMWFSGHLSVVRDICLHEGKLFSASADGTAKCWDVDNGKCYYTLSGHGAAVTAVTVGSQGQRIFTGSSDGNVRQFIAEITEDAGGA